MKQVVTVFGATGKVGQQVIRQLLCEPFSSLYSVRICARNVPKAKEQLTSLNLDLSKVTFITADLSSTQNNEEVSRAVSGADFVIWTVGSGTVRSWLRDYLRLLTGQAAPADHPEEVDYAGLARLLPLLDVELKRLVVVSSVAVTRPYYPVAMFLNALLSHIMHWKLKAERLVRTFPQAEDGKTIVPAKRGDKKIPYTIVRPGGLVRSSSAAAPRPLLVAQGDKISGRIFVGDVATLCLEAMVAPQCLNATFECVENPSGKTKDYFEEIGPDREPLPEVSHYRPLILLTAVGSVALLLGGYLAASLLLSLF